MKFSAPSELATSVAPVLSHDRIPQLDAMRGLAALIVSIGHAIPLLPWDDPSFAATLAGGAIRKMLDGPAMVDFFFALSGFVLAIPYLGPKGRPFDIIDFLVRRAARIYPAFWVAMLFALVLRMTSVNTLHAWASTETARLNWADPITFRTLIMQFTLLFGLPEPRMLNGPVWSICVELQAAVILPLFFFLIGAARSWKTVVAVSGLSFVIAYMIGPPSGLIFLPLFIMGVAAARFRTQMRVHVKRMSRPLCFGLGLFALSLIYNRLLTGKIGWRSPDLRPELITGVGATMLIVLADCRQEFATALSRPSLLMLGKVSYSHYLLHMPLFLWLFPIINRATGSFIACIVGGIAISLTLSWIVFHLVEQPGITAGRWLAKMMIATLPSGPISIKGFAPLEEYAEPRGSCTASNELTADYHAQGTSCRTPGRI